ncbi:MAG TPA: molecular chaperone DnaK [Myxococcaceae bacterium]|jgi:molecular chaperone DnaK
MAASQDPVIGIDLGTTNSVVATVQGNQPVVIKNRSGQALTPSVVAVTKQGKRLVGQIAKRQAITNPLDTVFASKRLIGRKFSSGEVQAALKVLPYEVVAGDHDDVRVMLGGQKVSLPEVSGLVLHELKQDAEAYYGRPVSRAVITVPAYFNDGQRQATKDAGKIAGLEVLRIVNEPTAAALAYGFGKNVHGKIAVFDLGGGTFDISVLEVGGDVFDVIAVGGDTFLGGEDFDLRVIDWLVLAFAKEHGIDLRKDRMALQRLKDAAERAKIDLSGTRETQVNLPFIVTPPGGGAALHLQIALTREKLEELTQDLVNKAVGITETVLKEAKVRPADLKEIILVGGQTRMPLVTERVKAYFHRDPCKGVHPEEVVALGAAIQASALTAEAGQVLLLDVTPQSLGVAIAGGYRRTLISKNTTVPTSATELFHTSKDAQTTVKIIVLQGEKEMAHQNELLGEFVLSGLREAPRGVVEIEVTFEINSEGIVSVSARDRETGQRQSITVTASGALTEEELQKILDAQRDYMLEARSSEVVGQRKVEVAALAKELKDMIPRLRQLTGGSEFGQEAIGRAEKVVSAAEEVLAGQDLKQLTDAVDQLTRTTALFRGVLERIGAGES